MHTMIKRLGCWLTIVWAGYGAVGIAQEKPGGYPQRPIRIIISVAPGAGADMIARATAQLLTDQWGQNAVVESRPGGGGVIAVELAAKSTPDGHTLLQYGDGMTLIGAQKRVPFDVLKAFEPVVASSSQAYVLMGHLSLPAKSVKELIDLSVAKPLTYGGGGGIGATVHVGMERFAMVSGVKLKYVSYKGSAPAILAVMGGEIQLATGSAMAATGAIRSGKVRGIATLGPKRTPSLPDLPTANEQGVSGFTLTNRYNLWVAAGTPRPIINALNKVVTEGMNSPQMRQRLNAEGSEPPERMTPEQLKALVAREYVETEQMVKKMNLKLR